MAIRIRLPGGTLKIKHYLELRRAEREREVPVWKIGGRYVIWWPKQQRTRRA